jgi:hypothetical protein
MQYLDTGNNHLKVIMQTKTSHHHHGEAVQPKERREKSAVRIFFTKTVITSASRR